MTEKNVECAWCHKMTDFVVAPPEGKGLCICLACEDAYFKGARATSRGAAATAPSAAPTMQPYIPVTELRHLAWVLVHDGLEPKDGFGGCSCDTCSLLRDCMKAVREKEVKEYLGAAATAPSAPPTEPQMSDDEMAAWAWVAEAKQHIHNLLGSAHPNKKEHPAMFEAWRQAQHFLDNGPAEVAPSPMLTICPICDRGVDRICDALAVHIGAEWYHKPCSRFAPTATDWMRQAVNEIISNQPMDGYKFSDQDQLVAIVVKYAGEHTGAESKKEK